MKTKYLPLMLSLLACAALAGCGDTTIHEPGVYKGPADPQATPEAAQERAEALRQRALLAHSDR